MCTAIRGVASSARTRITWRSRISWTRCGSRAAACRRTTCSSADRLLETVQQRQDAAYLERLRDAASTDGALLALDFGGTQPQAPWQTVAADTAYSPDPGFGWLPPHDDSVPTPEESYYAMAQKYGAKFTTDVTAGQLLFWPYKQPSPVPLRTNLRSGTPRRFRVDIPPGAYAVRVVTTNPAWTNRNFLVSGMVAVNGAVRLLDAPHDKGAIVSREFTASAPDGRLEFTFGGPTGWAVAALVIRPATEAEEAAETSGGLRSWRVSPRYSNPDWYPIYLVSAPPEKRLASLPERAWQTVQAPPTGLPVVDLGINKEADVGDVVYAATTIESDDARRAFLHFSASSQAQLWLNGEPLGYVPNEKGVRRDEFVAPVTLRAGENTLVVKLQRFWERHWMFYAGITDGR